MTVNEGGGHVSQYATEEYPRSGVTRAAGPVAEAAAAVRAGIDELDAVVSNLIGRLSTALDQRDEPSPDVPAPTEIRRSPSCELGVELDESARRLRGIARVLASTTARVEL
jgi:hypothetical protein